MNRLIEFITGVRLVGPPDTLMFVAVEIYINLKSTLPHMRICF